MPVERIAIRPSDKASRINTKLTETLTGNRTITVEEIETYNGFSFDPGGARNLVLPPEEACKGVVIYISNEADAAEVITVKDDGGSTIGTPTQNEAIVCWCDGVRWFGLVGASS
jgi:hypothetical protein